ncbi:MAG: hypothetical protein R3E34_01685 [Rhodocyclaceae bacterium]
MKYDYGSSVRIVCPETSQHYTGSVCGFREIVTPETAEKFRVPIGTILVLVERSDGAAIEVPEDNLEPLA